jgi:pimeloyl-ACP methyl ester carboxylesterase
MGAMTALVFAGLYPDVPKAILLEDPPSFWMSTAASREETETRRAGMKDWLASLKDKTREELIEGQRQETPQWSQQELELWAESKLRVSPNALKLFVAEEKDWPGLLSKITCPVLLIRADPDRFAIVTSEAAEHLQSLLPQVRIAHIANAGHCIHRDQFDDYMSDVKAFLSQM